jgi:hypothetical protein
MSIHPEENNALMNLRDTGLGGMSALGQKQTFEKVRLMSGLPPKADIAERDRHVRFVPKADICSAAKLC